MKCPTCKGSGEIILAKLSFGGRLRVLREAKGMSLRDVEKKVGFSNAALSQCESGKIKNPSFLLIMKLCELYGIKPSELMESA